MIPNVRGSVADYANEKCVYAGRCLGPINRPCAVAGLKPNFFLIYINLYNLHLLIYILCPVQRIDPPCGN